MKQMQRVAIRCFSLFQHVPNKKRTEQNHRLVIAVKQPYPAKMRLTQKRKVMPFPDINS
jgi:hypothetical protein